MRKRVFLDANIIISGTFFVGNESRILSLGDIELMTSDLVVEEVKEVVARKFKSLRVENQRIGLVEVERSFFDFDKIVDETEYSSKIPEAKKIVHKEKDSKILAAVLALKPDYFITGDEDFFIPEVQRRVPVMRTKEFLKKYGIL